MKVLFGNEKHLEFSRAIRMEDGDIKVFGHTYGDEISVYLTEYKLDWYICIENPWIEPWEPEICRWDSFLVKNQLDIYRLNASL